MAMRPYAGLKKPRRQLASARSFDVFEKAAMSWWFACSRPMANPVAQWMRTAYKQLSDTIVSGPASMPRTVALDLQNGAHGRWGKATDDGLEGDLLGRIRAFLPHAGRLASP